jgi:hypothetical protein
MLPPESYVPFDDSNREHINNIIHARWRKHRPLLFISLAIPLISIGVPVVCAFFYLIVIIFNIVHANGRFRNLYADLKRDEKLIIPFHPYPYCIPDVGRYYIKTNISIYPYISIDQETYYWMNTEQILYMEVAPKSEVIFSITAEEAPAGEVIPMLETPSQSNDRKRWN